MREFGQCFDACRLTYRIAGGDRVLAEEGLEVVALGPDDTKFGSIESLSDAEKCADLFKGHRDQIDGMLVTLPNFGDERAVANTLRLSGLDVPVLALSQLSRQVENRDDKRPTLADIRHSLLSVQPDCD